MVLIAQLAESASLFPPRSTLGGRAPRMRGNYPHEVGELAQRLADSRELL